MFRTDYPLIKYIRQLGEPRSGQISASAAYAGRKDCDFVATILQFKLGFQFKLKNAFRFCNIQYRYLYYLQTQIFVSSELRNGWLIRTASKSFAVYAATSTEKQEWMAHINKCIEDLLRKSNNFSNISQLVSKYSTCVVTVLFSILKTEDSIERKLFEINFLFQI